MVFVIRLNKVKNLYLAAFYSSKCLKLIKMTLFSLYKIYLCLSWSLELLQKFSVCLVKLIIALQGQNDANEGANSGQRPCNSLTFLRKC